MFGSRSVPPAMSIACGPSAARMLAASPRLAGARKLNQGRRIMTRDRKSTRLNSSHTEIYTLSLHDALPISRDEHRLRSFRGEDARRLAEARGRAEAEPGQAHHDARSEEHTSELQSHRDLHSFPTRRSSDLPR